MGGSNKQGAGITSIDAKVLINITANKYFSECCRASLVDCLGSSTTIPSFYRFLSKKVENLINGGIENFFEDK